MDALVCDSRGGRAAVADGKMEAFADRRAMGIGRRHGDRVACGNGGDCERTALSGIRSTVRTESLDELIAAVLVKYIVFKVVGREQDAAVVE